MAGEAGLQATEYISRSQARLQKALEWQMRTSATKARLAEEAKQAEAELGITYEVDPEMLPFDQKQAEAQADAELKRQRREKLKKGSFVQSASTALNNRFSDMFKAFQYVDLDRSGTLDKQEVRRALDLWNIPIDDEKLDELIEACDHDGDGQVDYKEFVDVLARDTVAPAALGKRDMQAKEAMGVESLDKAFLGHGNAVKNARASINDSGSAPSNKQAAAAAVPAPQMAVPMSGDERAARREKLKKGSFVQSASTALNNRFSDMFKAFQYVDLDRSGTLDKQEVRRALDLWNIPIDDEKLDELIEACDHDGDGQVDYKEFVDVLARDTVAPAALGKRDMQAKEAMGVESLDKAFLGHGNAVKNARASIND